MIYRDSKRGWPYFGSVNVNNALIRADQLSSYFGPKPAVTRVHARPAHKQVVYIGDEGPELSRLILENGSRRFLRADPSNGLLSSNLLDCARALKRR